MKKVCLIILMLITFGGHVSAYAYTSCVGGKEIKYTGYKTFTLCKSTGTMNYYNALLWCRANGGQLATDAFLSNSSNKNPLGCDEAGGDGWIYSRKRSCSYNLYNASYALTSLKRALCQ